MAKFEDKAPEKAAKPKNPNRKSIDVVKSLRFFKDVYFELKKVTWPTRKELKINTATVLVVTLVAAIMIGILDYCMSRLYSIVVG